MTRQATARACANIALVKYWGKKDSELNLPAAGSLSLTLDALTTTTTVAFGSSDADRLIVDGIQMDGAPLSKALRVVDSIRKHAGLDLRVQVTSRNDFPMGAGLASSASGLAALTLAAARAAGLKLKPSKLSRIARLGSGSACRSIFGGFVEWAPGSEVDGSDCLARPLYPPEHWDLRVIIAVVNQAPKPVGSTEGMLHTSKTSPFHTAFLGTIPTDLSEARRAIQDQNLPLLGRVAERCCLRMHADMMAADPPLLYLRPETLQVLQRVRSLQDQGSPVFFTVDAGPNVKVFCASEAASEVEQALEVLGCIQQLIHARPGPDAEVLSS